MPTGLHWTCRAGMWVMLAALVCQCGCARTRVEVSLAGVVEEGDINAEMDFWDALSERPVVCNDEALHGLLLFVDGADLSTSYEERVARARERGWVEKGWSEPGNVAMQRGVVARALAVHCGIKGGVMMHVLGPNPRYAMRELQYMGLMGPGSEQQALSGREFMGALSKAQDYLLLQEAIKRAKAGEGASGAASDAGEGEGARGESTSGEGRITP